MTHNTIAVAVMTAIGETTLESRPRPVPSPGEVLVEVASVGVCGSDVHWYTDGHIGNTWVRGPLVLGHEASGTIVEVGAGVPPERVGQRVAIEPGIPCRRCTQCLAGHYNLCADVKFYATPPVDGAFATHVLTDQHFAHPVPEILDDDQAALIEPLAVAVWAARKAQLKLGDRVLISGAGTIGLLSLQVARAAGALVSVSDPSSHRRDLARRLGAHTVIDPTAGPVDGTFDVLLECSGSGAAILSGISLLGPAGRAVLVGMAADPHVSIPLDALQGRELTLTGTFRYANVYPEAIRLAAERLVVSGDLVTSHHGLDDVHAALTISSRDPLSIKPIVNPNRPTKGSTA